ncbi:Bgt-645 [Blumeria graminis f. sp. tritici]|uniref:Bgt-645 n=2 Tax=Blumeria graminis f. sp. tritici TaxID=62690 RepID=A0A9X9MJY5_BLUGR|nr:hypothetical protein BGT96224_645 [Blumeria graminis f. sp. tritici 96224]VDB90705.1 Bgt-645 [Blumeria graminis f. sp. tritici]
MAVQSHTRSEITIVGLGVLVTCTIYFTMRQTLAAYRDSFIIPPSENKPQYITQEVEDSLKLSTLEKLVDSPSWVIRDTTNTIICERALHDEASFTTVLHCLTQPEYEPREKGIRALKMMINNHALGFLHNPRGYTALVKCLENCVNDYEHNEFDPDWDNWHFRDVVEKITLGFLLQMVEKYGPNRLLRHRFIECWLAKEPWGATEAERLTNFMTLLRSSDQKLSGLVKPISRDFTGRRLLLKSKLVSETSDELSTNISTSDESTNADNYSEQSSDLLRRRYQNSADENMRRRHREAMVLNDGSRPLGRSDIFQRER